MPGEVREPRTASELKGYVGQKSLDDFPTRRYRPLVAEDLPIGRRQHVRIVISLAPDHDTVELAQMSLDLVETGDAAVHHDAQMGKIPLQLLHEFLAQRRHVAILLGTQPI